MVASARKMQRHITQLMQPFLKRKKGHGKKEESLAFISIMARLYVIVLLGQLVALPAHLLGVDAGRGVDVAGLPPGYEGVVAVVRGLVAVPVVLTVGVFEPDVLEADPVVSSNA